MDMWRKILPKQVIQIFDIFFKYKLIFSKEFIDVLTVFLGQNYFKFVSRYYQMDKGLIIEKAISPLAPDIFIDF